MGVREKEDEKWRGSSTTTDKFMRNIITNFSIKALVRCGRLYDNFTVTYYAYAYVYGPDFSTLHIEALSPLVNNRRISNSLLNRFNFIKQENKSGLSYRNTIRHSH